MFNVHTKNFLRTLLPSLALACTLSACGGGSAPAAPSAATAVPAAAPAVMKTFEQTCHNCHSFPASGAPQVGDKNAWATRIAQGRDTLLDHTINGYKSMPPMGTCTQCTEADFTALIEYMSGSQLK